MKTFAAQLQDFSKLTKKNLRYVAVNAIQDVVEGMQTPARGLSKGGTLQIGKIPVAESDLIKSLSSGIGSPSSSPSEVSYIAVIAGMQIGQVAYFAYTAAHAMRKELGFTGEDSLGRSFDEAGWHFMGTNVALFPDNVKKRVKELG